MHHWNRLNRHLRRLGPAGSLTIAVLASGLLFFGCIEFGQRMGWVREPVEPTPAPESFVDREIRVRLLGRNPRTNAELSVVSPYKILDTQARKPVGEPEPPCEDVQVKPSAGGGISIGKRDVPLADLTIAPTRDASLVLNGQTYRGTLRIQRVSGGLVFTNTLDVESYLRGVLRGELPRFFHPESFKAQCVSARTYVLYQKHQGPEGRTFDVYDDEGSQMYIGVKGEDNTANRAVDATRGEVCFYKNSQDDKIFCTYYSSACGGLSQHVNNVKPNDPDAPPLAGNVPCNDCSVARFYRWDQVKLAKTEVTRRLVARYPSLKRLGAITRLNPKALTSDGRVIRIELIGAGGASETLVGEDFRLAIGGRVLKSTNFTIDTTKSHFIFKGGKGFGHGMGLCQYGMEAKARKGLDYKTILAIYYPHSYIKKLY